MKLEMEIVIKFSEDQLKAIVAAMKEAKFPK